MKMSRFAVALLAAVAFITLVPVHPALIGSALAVPQHEAEEHGDDHGDDHDGAAHGEEAHDGEHGGEEHGDSHAAHGNTNPLSSNPDLALFTLIIFALLMLVLGKFAWGPISEALERREQNIADQISEAERSRDEARRLLEEHESKLANAQDEIRALMEEARKEADLQKSSILSEAETAAAEQQARAIREINAAKNDALEQLARSEVNRVVDLAGRIVGKELRADDHASMIADAVKSLPSDN